MGDRFWIPPLWPFPPAPDLRRHFNGKKVFYMRGILGQYVITIPEDDLIIVRLGHQVGDRPEGQEHSEDFYIYIEQVYKMLEPQ